MPHMKSRVRGAIILAVLSGAAALVYAARKRSRHGKLLENAADEIRTNVMKHAKRLGKLTKASYENIVDAAVEEYRGLKALTEKELKSLGDDVKDGWSQVEKMFLKKSEKPKNDEEN